MLFTICIPIYNGAKTISESLKSVLRQDFQDFKIIIVDNNSSDESVSICESFKDYRIKIYKFKNTVPAGLNFQRCIDLCDTDYLVFLSSDDVLDKNCLNTYLYTIQNNREISIISRTYYWFEENIRNPTRATYQFKNKIDINLKSDFIDIMNFIDSTCQLSGLCIKKNSIKNDIKPIPFVEIPSIILPILKTDNSIHLNYNSVAIRTSSSGANLKSTYAISPSKSWYELFEYNFSNNTKLFNFLVEVYISKNYDSLVQIRINGGYKKFIEEINFFINKNPKILFDIKFYIYFLILNLPIFLIERIKNIYKKFTIKQVSLTNIIE